MRILVDADACPVKQIAEKVAQTYKIPMIMFIDTSHELHSEYSQVITVSQGPDAVDLALINQLEKGDIVITQDYGVASLALGKGGYAINQNGLIYTNENIDRLLFERFLGKKQRNSKSKSHQKGPKKRTQENNEHFLESFEKLIKQIINK